MSLSLCIITLQAGFTSSHSLLSILRNHLALSSFNLYASHPTKGPLSLHLFLSSESENLPVRSLKPFRLVTMVQGQPAIDWKKPENNAKLIAAVLDQFSGNPDCKKIAKTFGEFAPVALISEHEKQTGR